MPQHDDMVDALAYALRLAVHRNTVRNLFYRGGWHYAVVACGLMGKWAVCFLSIVALGGMLPRGYLSPVPMWYLFLLSGVVGIRMVLLGMIQDRIALINRTCPGAPLRLDGDEVRTL